MAGWSMRDKTCIVGVGTTEYGSFPETDAYGLGVKALNLALEDCGLGYEDIDGLIVNRIAYDRFSQITNINPQYMLATEMHGRFSAPPMWSRWSMATTASRRDCNTAAATACGRHGG